MSTGRLIQLNILAAHILVGIWLVVSPSWSTALWGLAGILCARLGGEVYNHRYLAHRSFKLKPWLEPLLFFFSNATGVGSSLSWVAVHRHHHKHADTPLDVHSPRYKGMLKVWLTLWDPIPPIKPMLIKDILRDKKQVLMNKHYFKFYYSWVCILVILSLVTQSWIPIISFHAIPLIWGLHNGGIVDAICHRYGYRNFETSDDSRNNTIANIIGFGTGLHNNHHKHPGQWNFAMAKGEIDPTSWIVRLIKC